MSKCQIQKICSILGVSINKLTLVFSVDKIRFTTDILSSFIPVLRISGRSSDKSITSRHHQHKLQD